MSILKFQRYLKVTNIVWKHIMNHLTNIKLKSYNDSKTYTDNWLEYSVTYIHIKYSRIQPYE